MMNQNKPRGIFFNKNAVNIQQNPATQQQPSNINNEANNLDNLKAAALTSSSDIINQQPNLKKLFLNLNSNTSNATTGTINDENALEHQKKATLTNKPLGGGLKQLNLEKLNELKANLMTKQQLNTKPTNKVDDFALVDLASGQDEHLKKDGRASPNEPSFPNLRSHKRTSLQDLLQLQQVQNKVVVPNENLVEDSQVRTKKHKEPDAEDKVFSNLDLKPPQDSVISRIPRLSLRLPQVPLLLNPEQRKSSVVPQKQPAKRAISGPLFSIKDEEIELEEDEEEIENIDIPTSRDAIFLVCDIAQDIYEYMYVLEKKQAVREDYLKDQKVFTPKVRQRLINWCIEIHNQLDLLPETMYTTISIMDRFFDKVQVREQNQVQLVAVGCTLIASKYEEIYPPELADLLHLTQNSYSKQEIMRVEIKILEELNFDLGKPIPLAFLRRYSKAAHSDLKKHSIAKYLMELSLNEYQCSHWRPSMLAAAALFATIHIVQPSESVSSLLSSGSARITLRQPAKNLWTKSLVHYTHYTKKELQGPAGILCKILRKAQKNPQSYYCVKKNQTSLSKWPELKSSRVDELIKLADQL